MRVTMSRKRERPQPQNDDDEEWMPDGGAESCDEAGGPCSGQTCRRRNPAAEDPEWTPAGGGRSAGYGTAAERLQPPPKRLLRSCRGGAIGEGGPDRVAADTKTADTCRGAAAIGVATETRDTNAGVTSMTRTAAAGGHAAAPRPRVPHRKRKRMQPTAHASPPQMSTAAMSTMLPVTPDSAVLVTPDDACSPPDAIPLGKRACRLNRTNTPNKFKGMPSADVPHLTPASQGGRPKRDGANGPRPGGRRLNRSRRRSSTKRGNSQHGSTKRHRAQASAGTQGPDGPQHQPEAPPSGSGLTAPNDIATGHRTFDPGGRGSELGPTGIG